ncbi:MAG: DUF3387 domain-containing protein, partial [Clostridium sp.]|nr:DUF3387 domain-containing protein [Clostridium sp.]
EVLASSLYFFANYNFTLTILLAIAEKYGFKDQFTEEKLIVLAKEIKKLVSNKSKYTDWTNRQDVKDELYADVAVLLKRNGYPPKTIDAAYDEIMKQVENYKKYEAQSAPTEKAVVYNIASQRNLSMAAEAAVEYEVGKKKKTMTNA